MPEKPTTPEICNLLSFDSINSLYDCSDTLLVAHQTLRQTVPHDRTQRSASERGVMCYRRNMTAGEKRSEAVITLHRVLPHAQTKEEERKVWYARKGANSKDIDFGPSLPLWWINIGKSMIVLRYKGLGMEEVHKRNTSWQGTNWFRPGENKARSHSTAPAESLCVYVTRIAHRR